MARATTKEKTRPYICKLCDSVDTGWHGKSEGSVTRHVLMTYGVKDKNNIHKIWKTSHNLPIRPTPEQIKQNIPVVMEKWLAEICELYT